jgi:archaellum component FlaF (FlaF/FlaG flagellin family)
MIKFYEIAYLLIIMFIIYAIYRSIKNWYDNVQETKEEQNQLLKEINNKLDKINQTLNEK